MASTGVVADSYGGPARGRSSTPPDYYSTFMSMRGAQKPQPKKDNSTDETLKALQAVFEVFKRLEEKGGGKPDPNLEAAREAIKKYVASQKIDPSQLTGEQSAPAEGATPPPDTQTPPAPGSATAPQGPTA